LYKYNKIGRFEKFTLNFKYNSGGAIKCLL
jgi:hypothetical protein